MMKKRVIAAAMAMAAWSGSSLGGAGLGMSIQSGDPTIYVPIDIGESFRLEPFFRYGNDKSESRVYEPSSPYTVREVREATTYQLGLGLFGSAGFNESVRAYFGGRLSYISAEFEYSFDGGSRPPFTSFPPPEKIDSDGFSIEPTIGLEYRFTERFSIAGEVALIVSDVDGNAVSTESVDTDSNVIVRFRF
jgi:hypothetical protein